MPHCAGYSGNLAAEIVAQKQLQLGGSKPVARATYATLIDLANSEGKREGEREMQTERERLHFIIYGASRSCYTGSGLIS